MKPLEIGGQGVIEGVMIKNQDNCVMALRKSNNEIDYLHDEHKGIEFSSMRKLPLLRGVFALIDYLVLSIKTMSHSVDFYEDDRREKPSIMERFFVSMFGTKGDDIFIGISTLITVALSVLVFMVLPYKAGEYLANNYFKTDSKQIMAEVVIRAGLFIFFVIMFSFRKDINRTFKYHGAEHKVLNCLKKGEPLCFENVKKCSKFDSGCKNNFIFLVAFLSIVLFGVIRSEDIWKLLGLRLLVAPIVAAVSYEFVRLAGKKRNPIITLFNLPAMIIQFFMVREPKNDMIEVAIAAVEAAFDWRSYIGMGAADGYMDNQPVNDSFMDYGANKVSFSDDQPVFNDFNDNMNGFDNGFDNNFNSFDNNFQNNFDNKFDDNNFDGGFDNGFDNGYSNKLQFEDTQMIETPILNFENTFDDVDSGNSYDMGGYNNNFGSFDAGFNNQFDQMNNNTNYDQMNNNGNNDYNQFGYDNSNYNQNNFEQNNYNQNDYNNYNQYGNNDYNNQSNPDYMNGMGYNDNDMMNRLDRYYNDDNY